MNVTTKDKTELLHFINDWGKITISKNLFMIYDDEIISVDNFEKLKLLYITDDMTPSFSLTTQGLEILKAYRDFQNI